MSAYTTGRVSAAADRAVATAHGSGRRPTIELPTMTFKPVNDADSLPSEDDPSPLDVPAFLRRHEG
jgi:hypothetical protein